VRYIHLNPLRAGLVRGMRGLDAYPWSGHGVLLGRSEAELQAGSRRQAVVEARAALAWLGKVELALPTRLVANAVGVSSVSVNRLLERGRAALAKRGLESDVLLRKCIL